MTEHARAPASADTAAKTDCSRPATSSNAELDALTVSETQHISRLLTSLRAHAHSPHSDVHGEGELHTRAELEAGVRLVLSHSRTEPVEIVSQVISYAAMLKLGDQDLYRTAAKHTASRINEFDPTSKDLSRFCWALGHAHAADPSFWKATCAFVKTHADVMTPKWFCTMAEAAAMSGSKDPELFGVLARGILEHRDELSTSGIRRVRHAFNSIDLTDRRLLSEVVGSPIHSIDKCSGADRALVLDVLLNLGVRGSPVTDRLAENMTRELSTAPIRDISNDARRLSQLKLRADWYFGALASAVENRIDQCQGTDVVNFAKVFAIHPPRNRDLMNTLSERALTLSESGKLSLANTLDLLEQFGHAKFADSDFLRFASQRLGSGCAHLETADLVRAAEGFARLREPADEFFHACRDELTRRFAQQDPSGDALSRLLLAFGEVRQEPGSLFEDGVCFLVEQGTRNELRDVVRATYAALMVSDEHARSLFKVGAELCERRSHELDGALTLFMYWSAHALGESLPSALKERAEAMVSEMANQRPSTNAFEHRVAQTLREMGYEPTLQVPLFGYAVDMMVEAGGQLWAIECDGSHVHQVGRTFTDKMLGRYVVRDKVLAGAGIKTIHISNEEEAFRFDLSATILAKLAA